VVVADVLEGGGDGFDQVGLLDGRRHGAGWGEGVGVIIPAVEGVSDGAARGWGAGRVGLIA
jgi:hypothetical protein